MNISKQSFVGATIVVMLTVAVLGGLTMWSEASDKGPDPAGDQRAGATQRRVSTIDVSLVRSFNSWHDLKAASMYVVVGTAGSQQSEVNAHHFPWTTTEVTVDRMLVGPQGQVPRTLPVRQRGSNAPGNETVVIGFPLLIPGQQYLLFLTPTVIIPNVYYPVGSYQGVFAISKDDLVSSISPQAAQAGVPVDNAPLTQIVQAILGA